MTEMQQISHEIMVFMRGHYQLDEVPGMYYDTPCLRFRQGKKTLVTFCLYPDHYGVQIVLGKAEREKFEAIRHEFPLELQALYDREPTHYDGKWLMLHVENPADWEVARKLILLKKKPNRKPFPMKGAIYAQCGQRCDLCIHYTGTTKEQRAMMEPLLNHMWGDQDWSMRCGGCESDTCYCKDDPCPSKICAHQKGLAQCKDCKDHPCLNATVGDPRSMLQAEAHSADEITWALLPYVPWQYEKQQDIWKD